MTNFLVRLIRYLPWLGIVMLVAGFGLAISKSQFTEVAGGLSILGLVFFLMIFARGESSNLKFYVNVIAASLLTLGILVVVYLWVAMYKTTWDLTKGKRLSLAEQSVKYVQSLKDPVKLIGLYNKTTNPPDDAVKSMLDRYAKLSDKVSVEIVDPLRDNLRVKELKDRFDTEAQEMELFVENAAKPKEEASKEKQKPRFKKLNTTDEKAITNAIIQVTQDKETIVYSLQGHGEKGTEYAAAGKKQTSISELVRVLTDQAIKVKPLLLSGPIPDDCGVLMAVGPTSDLLEPEAEIIKAYLKKGGKGLFFFDEPKTPEETLRNWASILKDYGIEVTDDLLCDYRGMSFMGDPTTILPAEFDSVHEITKDLSGATGIAFLGCRAINRVQPPPTGFTTTDLVKTSPLSWSQSLKDLLRAGKFVPPKDKMSVRSLALASGETSGEKGARVVVFADADIVTDQQKSNLSFAMAILSINWLAGQEDLVAIPPKDLEDTPLFVNENTMHLVFISVVLALPAAIFFGGLSYTMYRRRSR